MFQTNCCQWLWKWRRKSRENGNNGAIVASSLLSVVASLYTRSNNKSSGGPSTPPTQPFRSISSLSKRNEKRGWHYPFPPSFHPALWCARQEEETDTGLRGKRIPGIAVSIFIPSTQGETRLPNNYSLLIWPAIIITINHIVVRVAKWQMASQVSNSAARSIL